MGPTSPAPLPARDSAGKALREMAGGETSFSAPTRSDGRQRLKNERSLAELPMGDGEATGAETPAAPEYEIEIEDPRTPASPGSPAELAFNAFQTGEHVRGFEIALDQRYGIGEIAARAAVCGVEDDRRRVEQAEFPIQPGDGCFDDCGRAAEAPVRTVRSDRDCVEVRCMPHGRSPRSASCA